MAAVPSAFVRFLGIRAADGTYYDPEGGVFWLTFADDGSVTDYTTTVQRAAAQRLDTGKYLISVPLDANAGSPYTAEHNYAVVAEYTDLDGVLVSEGVGAFAGATTTLDRIQAVADAVRLQLPAVGAPLSGLLDVHVANLQEIGSTRMALLDNLTAARAAALDDIVSADTIEGIVRRASRESEVQYVLTAPVGADPRNVGPTGLKINYVAVLVAGVWAYQWWHYASAADVSPSRWVEHATPPGVDQ